MLHALAQTEVLIARLAQLVFTLGRVLKECRYNYNSALLVSRGATRGNSMLKKAFPRTGYWLRRLVFGYRNQ